jgi:hypothetical protein
LVGPRVARPDCESVLNRPDPGERGHAVIEPMIDFPLKKENVTRRPEQTVKPVTRE